MLLYDWEYYFPGYILADIVCCSSLDGFWTNRLDSFLICIPAISQRVVDDSTLALLNATLMKPQADSVVLGLASAIKLPVTLAVGTDPFSLDLMVRDYPAENTTYAKAYIPRSTIQGNTTLTEEPRRTPLHLPVWDEYVHRVVFEKTVPLSVKGTTVAHLGKLHSSVTLNKDVPLPGKTSHLEDEVLQN